MKRFVDLVAECAPQVTEVMPWDIDQLRQVHPNLLLLDIREPYEFLAAHIENSINVPRGILEAACEYGYEDTVPELVEARERAILVVCRSGNRSVLATSVMQQLGYQKVCSLKTGLRGWNDYELPLIKADGQRLGVDDADEYFMPKVKPEQMSPKA